MAKKMNDPKPSLFPPWQWPSCSQTKTLSFRALQNDIFALEEQPGADTGDLVEMVVRGLRSERLFFEPGKTRSIMEEANNKKIEACNVLPYKESVAVSMDSLDPYADFRVSMEEMVEAHGLKDWEGLEELLGWYLKANGKSNHGYILGAFVDLLVGLCFASSFGRESSSSFASSSFTISHSSPPSSPLSLPSSSFSTATPCLSQLLDQGVDQNGDEDPN